MTFYTSNTITPEYDDRIKRGALAPRIRYDLSSSGHACTVVHEQNDGWMSVEFDTRYGRRTNNFRRMKDESKLFGRKFSEQQNEY